MWHDFISYWMCRSLYCYIENSQRLRRLIQNQQVFIALCLSKSKVQSLYRYSSSRGLILFLLPVRILHASSHSLRDFSFYYRLLFFSEIYNQMILWVHSEVTYDLYISRLYIYIYCILTHFGRPAGMIWVQSSPLKWLTLENIIKLDQLVCYYEHFLLWQNSKWLQIAEDHLSRSGPFEILNLLFKIIDNGQFVRKEETAKDTSNYHISVQIKTCKNTLTLFFIDSEVKHWLVTCYLWTNMRTKQIAAVLEKNYLSGIRTRIRCVHNVICHVNLM